MTGIATAAYIRAVEGAYPCLERVVLRGYKTFSHVEIGMTPINILIGANGAGKSNFISAFRLLRALMEDELDIYVARKGGAEHFLYHGSKVTQKIHISLQFAMSTTTANIYTCELVPADEKLLISREAIYFHDRERYPEPVCLASHTELSKKSALSSWARSRVRGAQYVENAMRSWQVYHFHDTSDSARVKQSGSLHENHSLLSDAGNLAAYLYFLREKYPEHYEMIRHAVRTVAPFFGDFVLRPNPFQEDSIRLEWRERGSDLTFGPNDLSDGTLRFICLATLFLQPPEKRPHTIILDEPELGLHPAAIVLLAEMIRYAATTSRVIISTQSVTLLNQFSSGEVIIVERWRGTSVLLRPSFSELESWLKDYTLGALWEKNILGGHPHP